MPLMPTHALLYVLAFGIHLLALDDFILQTIGPSTEALQNYGGLCALSNVVAIAML